MVSHAPTPWHQGKNYPSRILSGSGSDRNIIAGTCLPADEDAPNEVELANAAHIVLVANCHDELLAALIDAIEQLEFSGYCHDHPGLSMGRAAIAKAKGAQS